MSFQVELVGFNSARVVVMGQQQADWVVGMLNGIHASMACPVAIIPQVTPSEMRTTHSTAWAAFKSLVNRLP